MTENEIDDIVKKLIECPLSSYLVAKKTCISEQSIGNYRKGLTRPTAANAKLLEYFFIEEAGGLRTKNEDNNETKPPFMPKTGNIEVQKPENSSIITLINILKDTLTEKDKQIDRLLSIIESNNLQKQ